VHSIGRLSFIKWMWGIAKISINICNILNTNKFSGARIYTRTIWRVMMKMICGVVDRHYESAIMFQDQCYIIISACTRKINIFTHIITIAQIHTNLQ
jgi:hypothetical protein